MPWVSRKPSSNRITWISAGVAAVLFGILTGYALWGQAASLASNVEHHLNTSDARVRNLEKRLQALEAQVGIGNASAPAKTPPTPNS